MHCLFPFDILSAKQTCKHFFAYIYEEHLTTIRCFSYSNTKECLTTARCFLVYIIEKCLAIATCFLVYISHHILQKKHKEPFSGHQGLFSFTSDTYGVKFLGFFHMKVYTPFVKEGDWRAPRA
jgi:hypothetical protein